MHFTQEQRDAWNAGTRDSLFNQWLRERTTGRNGLLDLDLLHGVATEFGVDAARYGHLNPGQKRMNVGNRLRRLVPESVYGAVAGSPPTMPHDPGAPPGRPPVVAASDWPFMTTATVTDLLRMQAGAIEELRSRDVVRTGNAPLGDYAEHLFAAAFGWKLTPNSAKSHDAVDDHGVRYQIKARRLRIGTPGERKLGVMRALPDGGFDHLAAVLFDNDFTVRRAALVPHATVLALAAHIRHVNGWRFMLDDAVWDIDGVADATQMLRNAVETVDDRFRHSSPNVR